MNEAISFIVISSGLVSGSILGATLATNTEKERRHRFGRALFLNSQFLGLILNITLWLLFVSVVFTVIGVGILVLGGAYPLSQSDRIVWVTSFFAGALLAKWLRYLYWARNA
jgi:hypothetical protein